MNYLSNSKRYAASAAVLESIGTFKVLVCRHGKLSNTVKVRWVTWCSADGHVLVRHHFCPISPLCLLKLPCIGRRWGSCYEIFFTFGCSLKVEQSASENWGQRAGLSSREIMYAVAKAWREISMHCPRHTWGWVCSRRRMIRNEDARPYIYSNGYALWRGLGLPRNEYAVDSLGINMQWPHVG